MFGVKIGCLACQDKQSTACTIIIIIVITTTIIIIIIITIVCICHSIMIIWIKGVISIFSGMLTISCMYQGRYLWRTKLNGLGIVLGAVNDGWWDALVSWIFIIKITMVKELYGDSWVVLVVWTLVALGITGAFWMKDGMRDGGLSEAGWTNEHGGGSRGMFGLNTVMMIGLYDPCCT